MLVRVCPECGEEFRPEIVACSDCGATLEDRFDEQDDPAVTAGMPGGADGADGGEPSADPAAQGTFVRILGADRAADLEPLAQRLGRAGLPFQVRASQLSFELLAREEDHERVREALGDLLKPDLPGSDAQVFDPEAGDLACPACGSQLAPATEECPECGLTVGGEEP
jgi:DNA-directed RNA polymerase subunit RPC12/RpoP